MRLMWACAPVFAVMLSGCGGEGGDERVAPTEGGSYVVINPDGSSTDVIMEPVSPPYQSARDFSVNRIETDVGLHWVTFEDTGAGADGREKVLASTLEPNAGNRIQFEYFADPERYVVTFLGAKREFRNFEPRSISSDEGHYEYQLETAAGGSKSISLYRYTDSSTRNPSVPMDYVGLMAWIEVELAEVGGREGRKSVSRIQLYGARTLASNTPKSGAWNYRLPISPISPNLSVRMDWATRRLTGVGNVVCSTGMACEGGTLGTLTVEGNLDSNQRLSGSFGGTAGYRGSFAGGFYGPFVLELGVLGTLIHPTHLSMPVIGFGKR